MSKHPASLLRPQALRLPQRARVRVEELANDLRASGDDVTAAEAMRGLCQLALQLADGAVGAGTAEAFRIPASDPTPQGVNRAIQAFLLLLDGEPSMAPTPSDTDAQSVNDERPKKRKRSRKDLHHQALRLPQRARQRLAALALELRAAGADVTAGEAARGLCLLALDLSTGVGGAKVAEAFRIVARDPTADGVRRALKALCSLVDGEPSTTRTPPMIDVAVPTPPGGSSPPPPLPRAA